MNKKKIQPFSFSYSIVQSCWIDEPQKRPSFEALVKKWEYLMTRSTKYLDVTDDSLNGSLNPSEAETAIIQDDEIDAGELKEALLPLWTPPMFTSPEMKGIDNKKYFDSSVDQAWQMGYDVPRPQSEAQPDNKSMRYENIRMSSRNSQSSYQRMSQPDLAGIANINYDRPMSNKRVRSYLEMDKFDPHIQNNLTNEMKQEKLGKEVEEISFKFVSNGILQQ